MFKGFGPSYEPSVEDIINSGLIHYEHIQKCCADEPDTQRLLASAVVKFSNSFEDPKSDHSFDLARVAVSNYVQLMLDTIRDLGDEYKYSLFQTLTAINNFSIDELNNAAYEAGHPLWVNKTFQVNH